MAPGMLPGVPNRKSLGLPTVTKGGTDGLLMYQRR